MNLLGADIGGTKTLLAIAASDGRLLREQRYRNADFAGFDAVLDAFLADAGGAPIASACCAVAGPLAADGGSARLTNLDWRIDAGRITARLGGAAAVLINDFAAVGLGIDRLDAGDIVTWHRGEPRARAPRVVTGAGTGLGTGWLVHDGERYRAYPSEGGHVDFAPNGARQRELLAWLEQHHRGHVSVERIVSGPGLVDLFRFCCEADPIGAAELAQALAAPDPAARISARAVEAPASPAAAALDLFVSIYGAVAGNLALVLLPHGGLYIAGGIAPKLIDRLREGPFLSAFNDKGRMSALTATIPVSVIMNPSVGLLGTLQAAQDEVGVNHPDRV
jgi:glucokinase